MAHWHSHDCRNDCTKFRADTGCLVDITARVVESPLHVQHIGVSHLLPEPKQVQSWMDAPEDTQAFASCGPVSDTTFIHAIFAVRVGCSFCCSSALFLRLRAPMKGATALRRACVPASPLHPSQSSSLTERTVSLTARAVCDCFHLD